MKVKEVIEIVRFLLRIGPNVLWESDPLKVRTLEGEGSVTPATPLRKERGHRSGDPFRATKHLLFGLPDSF